jgi:hypothetical protein
MKISRDVLDAAGWDRWFLVQFVSFRLQKIDHMF